MLPRFKLEEPRTLEEALELCERYGPSAAVYAGGTELLLVMKEGLIAADRLINVKFLQELKGIRLDESTGALRIGALATHREIETSPEVRRRWPVLARVAGIIANVRVRASGTIGGNLAFAEPHSDPPCVLQLYDAVVVIRGKGGERRVPASEFTLGPFETALQEGELIVAVELPRPAENVGVSYQRFAFRERPTASVGVALDFSADGAVVERARVSVGSVDWPRRLPEVEAELAGLERAQLPEKAAELAAMAARLVEPAEDLYGSEVYKRELTEVLARRALLEAGRGNGRVVN